MENNSSGRIFRNQKEENEALRDYQKEYDRVYGNLLNTYMNEKPSSFSEMTGMITL